MVDLLGFALGEDSSARHFGQDLDLLMIVEAVRCSS
jgi:hypothetical protein